LPTPFGILNKMIKNCKRLVHHKDKNINNNDLENIEILCYSCHAKEHDIYKNLIKEVITNE